MEHDVEGGDAVGVHEPPHSCAAFGGSDVLGERVGPADGADGDEVDPDDEGSHGGMVDGHLDPPSRRGAEVEHRPRRRQEAEPRVELEQLERRATPVPLLLGEVVVLVLALLPLRLAHLRRRRRDFPASGWGLGFWRWFCSTLRRRLSYADLVIFVRRAPWRVGRDWVMGLVLFFLWAFDNGPQNGPSPPFSFLISNGSAHSAVCTLATTMELGLALRLVAPPPPPCLSHRAPAHPPDFISSCVLRGRRVCASRLKHGAGAVCNAFVTYSGVEEEEMVEDVEEEAEAAVSTRPRLELIEKPDRSLALLDEYESEELGTSVCANHRSG